MTDDRPVPGNRPAPDGWPAASHDTAWWRRAVIYQVYPRSFADSNGDGIGDLPGLLSRLDYLASLGVDAVWISPFYRSPQDDNGYDISDYQDVDPMFGTLADVDALIAGLHERGMKLIIDVVLNHTSDAHPWFTESRSSKDSPKRDWYWWRPARDGLPPGSPGAEPTNWRSFFSPSAWQLDEATGEYYLHLFSVRQPDLNWENPEVRHALHGMLRWWLDRGVDGFRMDVINMVSKRLPLRDGPPLAGGDGYGDGWASFISGPRIHEFLRELHAEVIAGRDGALLTVGEMPGVSLKDAAAFTDPASAEVDMVFQFEHVELDRDPSDRLAARPLRLTSLKASLARWQAGLATAGWNSLYFGNHDQPRAVSRYGSDDPAHREASAKLLATVLHLHRGTPYVYQGEELGMTNYPFASADEIADIESRHYYRQAVDAGQDPAQALAALRPRSRDNARTPMQWDASPHAGFTTGTPWLPVNPNYPGINAAAQAGDPDSVLSYYRRLIALRHDLPVVAEGDFTLLLPGDERIWAFTRRLGTTELLVVANLSDGPAEAGIPAGRDWAAAELLLSNYPPPAAATFVLRAWEARVYRRSGRAQPPVG
jgi:oligo-1,6-glucosidase